MVRWTASRSDLLAISAMNPIISLSLIEAELRSTEDLIFDLSVDPGQNQYVDGAKYVINRIRSVYSGHEQGA